MGNITEYLSLASRWTHVSSAILWVGLLYFFNFVGSPYLATLEGEERRRYQLGLLPRALFWFRWAAAWTWISGLLLIGLVFYHSRATLLAPDAEGAVRWSWQAGVVVALTFTGHHLYDLLAKTVLRDARVAFFGGWALASGFFVLARHFGGFTDRGALIHLGALFGTLMAFNVWFRIWPANKRLLAAVREGTAPDPAWGALAALRSRHNTYLSVPIVLAMSNQHAWKLFGAPDLAIPAAILVGFLVVHGLYAKAGRVPAPARSGTGS